MKISGKKKIKKKNSVISEDTANPEHFFITFLVKTNAKQNRIFMDEEMLCIEINSPPVKGKANLGIIKLLSKTLNISKSQINLIKGYTSHKKTFYIHIPNIKIQEIYMKFSK